MDIKNTDINKNYNAAELSSAEINALATSNPRIKEQIDSDIQSYKNDNESKEKQNTVRKELRGIPVNSPRKLKR